MLGQPHIMQRSKTREEENRMKARPYPILSVILLLFSCLGTLRAQEFGSLSGVLTDPAGAAVVQARIKLQRASSGAVVQTVADAQGQFEFRNVEAGAYHLSA